jgi:PAS domain S-box-containing protein
LLLNPDPQKKLFLSFLKAGKDESLAPAIRAEARRIFDEHRRSLCADADRLFAWLFLLEWLGAIVWAVISTPHGWDGGAGSVLVVEKLMPGTVIFSLPLLFIFMKPGNPLTRQLVAVAQMLASGMLIVASGGRLETHFCEFSSLALLSGYRDWRVLLTAAAVAALDHAVRGLWLAGTIYGAGFPSGSGWLEHAVWISLCGFILALCVRRSLAGMFLIAQQHAELEASRDSTEQAVVQRTSELKLSEMNLRDSEATIRAILETAADSIITVSENGMIETANNACEQMFGLRCGEISGKHVCLLIKIVDGEVCSPDSWTALRDRGSPSSRALRVEGTGNCLKRGPFPVEISLSHVDLKGRKLITAIIRDSSERKNSETRVSEFYSIVSHELRTPLTSIRGSLGLIEGGLTGPVTSETGELVAIARESCDRLIRLINDILDLKKLESGKFEFHKMELDPVALLDAALSGTAPLAEERGVRLEIGWSTRQAIKADPDWLGQVLINLISNAVKFSASGGVVELSATSVPGGVRFAVRDQGCGIPQAEQHKLFNKFQQIDSSDDRRQEGTGLGLSICKAIVEQHGGSIGVDSGEDRGSIFWFVIPVAYECSFAGDLSAENCSQVLLIEREGISCNIPPAHLLPERCRITHLHSSDQAARIVEESIPDLVIFNVEKPDEADFQLEEKLHTLNSKYGKPVVLFAAGGLPERCGDDRRAGAGRAEAPAIGPTVLVVEDDASTRKTLVRQLACHGVRCLEAAGGRQALETAQSEAPDLIILDVGLPDMSGFQFVDNLKKCNSRLTPLLVYTGRDLSADERKMLTTGLTRYLTKSKASQDDLFRTVDEMLRIMRTPPLEKDE